MRRAPLIVAVAAACGVSIPLTAQDPPSFAEFLAGLRSEAVSRGIRQDVVDEALGHVEEPLPIVLERDRTQAEKVLPLETYIARHLRRPFIQAGQQMFARHRALVRDVTRDYGVPAPIIVAIWGLESNYGRFSGIRPTVTALTTLAWDQRRAAFFRGELFDALEILNRGDIEFSRMKGSWAGAMGAPQFMPSSYLDYAEDYDGDGRRDIWSSPADVFASIANYLLGHGWTTTERWGREVKLSPDAARRIADEVPRRTGTCQATREMTEMRPLKDWRALGVTLVSGRALPASAENAALVSGTRRHFLVSGNYDALLGYNCAHAYALTVGLLADRLGTSAGQ